MAIVVEMKSLLPAIFPNDIISQTIFIMALATGTKVLQNCKILTAMTAASSL